MAKSGYFIDKSDSTTIQAIIDGFDLHGTEYEDAIRAALSLHDRSFVLNTDRLDEVQPSPLEDGFSFDMDTDELILLNGNPTTLLDAILEMALYQRGFNTLIGVDNDWKTQIAIGAWRHVREALKVQLLIAPTTEKLWSASLELETTQRFNSISFAAMVYLAGCPQLDVVFPEGTSQLVITAYERLSRIFETIARDIGIDDYLTFNQRLGRAVVWVEESLLPRSETPFDDLFGSAGLSDRFFDDGPDNLL